MNSSNPINEEAIINSKHPANSTINTFFVISPDSSKSFSVIIFFPFLSNSIVRNYFFIYPFPSQNDTVLFKYLFKTFMVSKSSIFFDTDSEIFTGTSQNVIVEANEKIIPLKNPNSRKYWLDIHCAYFKIKAYALISANLLSVNLRRL